MSGHYTSNSSTLNPAMESTSTTKPKSGSINMFEPVLDRAAHYNYPHYMDEQEIEGHRAVYYIGFGGSGGGAYAAPQSASSFDNSVYLSGGGHGRRRTHRNSSARRGVLFAPVAASTAVDQVQGILGESANSSTSPPRDRTILDGGDRKSSKHRKRSSGGGGRHRRTTRDEKRNSSIYSEYGEGIDVLRKKELSGEIDDMIDPAERVHILLEGGTSTAAPGGGITDSVGAGATDTGVADVSGRLFIQMDTLKYLRIGANGEILTSTSPASTSPSSTTVPTTTSSPSTDNNNQRTLRDQDDTEEPLTVLGQTTSTNKDDTKLSTTTSDVDHVPLLCDIKENASSSPRQSTSKITADLTSQQRKQSTSPSYHSFSRDFPIWEEAARWVKFEEDVEPGSNRWSKPRVATLALHSLLELRSCILNGLLILDMECLNGKDVEDNLVSSLLSSNQITGEIEEDVRKILHAPHIPQYMKISNYKNVASSKILFPNVASLPSIAAAQSSAILNIGLLEEGKKRQDRPPSLSPPPSLPRGGTQDDIRIIAKTKSMNKLKNYFASAAKSAAGLRAAKSSTAASSSNKLLHHSRTSPGPLSPLSNAAGIGGTVPAAPGILDQQLDNEILNPHFHHPKFGNIHFMKKLPENAEAAHVLIGEAQFLTTPIIAFVRFRDSIYLTDATEVPIPSRFIFLLIGPVGYIDRYHEIGRCLATLMSDEIFHDVAYKAKNIQDILAGVDEFLDHVIVLPPCEWDPTIRIQPPLNVPPQINRVIKKMDKTGGTESDAKLIDHSDNTLVRTGRCCGGLISDIKRKLPWYWSDFRDGFSIQCIASFFFLYFACLAPIVTFGGLLSDATGNNLATIESLVSGAVCGISWALFSGQPLTIMGSTGPILVFESIVYSFCKEYGWNYLSFRCCIGLWTSLILLLMVVTDASVLVKYVTRFTEELFASLISLIFVYQALKNIWHIGEEYPVQRNKPVPSGFLARGSNDSSPPTLFATTVAALNMNFTLDDPSGISSSSSVFGFVEGNRFVPYVSDVFFLSVILFAGTFFLSAGLKSLRNTTYFPMSVRYMISDFAVLIAVFVTLGIDMYYGLATPKLRVPNSFRPTSHNRNGWLVNPLAYPNPWWTSLATVFPALLATILIFLDQQITAVIINRKENLLRKGCGYHLDLMVLALLVAICSLLGIPWFVAATVLSITHINSLRLETECAAPGERPKFLGVKEQRLTGLMIFTFIGLSVSMTKVLQHLPMPVLYGIFLYMGISSLKGVQFIQRISIMFMPQKYQPDYMFLRSVKTYRVHIFTLIQMTSLAALWAIKSYKTISICFPLMVAGLVGIRKLMEKIFTTRELSVLDDLMPDAEKKRKSIEEGSDTDLSPGGGGGESKLLSHPNDANNADGGDEHGKHHHKKHHHGSSYHHKKKKRPKTPWQRFTKHFTKYFPTLNSSSGHRHHGGDINLLAEAGAINRPNHDLKRFNNLSAHFDPSNTTTKNDTELNGIKGIYKSNGRNDYTSSPQGQTKYSNSALMSTSPSGYSKNEDSQVKEPLLSKSGDDFDTSTLQQAPLQPPLRTQHEQQPHINNKIKNRTLAPSQSSGAGSHKKLPHVNSMVDTMNITREVEKTAVWKALAKEKFLLNNSTSAGNMLSSNNPPPPPPNHHKNNKDDEKRHKRVKHHSQQQNHSKIHKEEPIKPNTSNDLIDKEDSYAPLLPPPSQSKFSIKIGSDEDEDIITQNLPPTKDQFDPVLVDPAKSLTAYTNGDKIDHAEDDSPHNFADKAYACAADKATLLKMKHVSSHDRIKK